MPITITDTRLANFYKQNPNFDILQFNLSSQAQVSGLNWQGLDQSTILDLLKKYQRLLRLNPNPAIAMTLLNTPVQGAAPIPIQLSTTTSAALPAPPATSSAASQAAPQPSASSAQPVGLGSAQAIAAIPQAQFVQQFAPAVGGAAVATQIHQDATTVAAKTMLLWANVHNLVASPYYRALQVNNTADDIYQFENLPNYQQLFGSLNFCECDECASIFGPAAYLVDLLRITDQYITTPNASTIDPNFTLNGRRPDLAQLQLTCENTNTLVPFLDIVNNVLESWIANHAQANPASQPAASPTDTVYTTLATATYPFNLPFNLPLEQLRRDLGQLNTDLATLYQTFNAPQDAVARETLGLSLEESVLITTPTTDATALSGAYGVTISANNLGGLTNQDTFLKQTGLSRQDLQDLLAQNLSSGELQNGNIAHSFYINQPLPAGQSLQLATDGSNTISNLNLATLDRLHRFIRLAQKLNWSFADLDWALRSLQASEITSNTIQSIAKIKQLQARLKLPLNALCSFWYDLDTIGVGSSGPSQALFDIIFNNPLLLRGQKPYHPQYEDAHAPFANPLYSDPVRKIPGENSSIAAGLRVSLDDLTALVTAFGNSGQLDLTVQNLSILYRHVQLATLVKLPIAQYLILLRLANKLQPVFSPDDLLSLLDVAAWLGSSGFNAYELDYILSGNTGSAVSGKYDAANIPAFLQSLQALGISTPPVLTMSDVVDWVGWLKALNAPTQPGPSQRIWSLLSSDMQQIITQAATTSTEPAYQQKSDLIAALNGILQRLDFYQQADFAGLTIPPQVMSLLQTSAIVSANEIIKLNRLLLEAAYPLAIAPSTVRQIDDEWKEKLIEQLATFVGSPTDIVEAAMEIVATSLTVAVPGNLHSYIEVFFNQPPDSNKPTYIEQALAALSRWLVLTEKLQLTSAEITSLRTSPASYGLPANFQPLTLDNLRSLSTFKQLILAFGDTQNQLVGYFANPVTATLTALTGWPPDQIQEAATTHFQNVPHLLTTVDGIATLKKAFDLSTSMGVNISFHDLILPAATAAAKDGLAPFSSAASQVISVVKAKYSDNDWATVSTTINNALNEVKRSALAAFVMTKLGLSTLRSLTEYLLIDVEMSGCASISYIKQAILSVQMYLQRCRLNLEPGVTSNPIPDIWWEWMMSFGIWQANRKVFLYPENYLDPGLRKSKTDLFQALEAELLQSDITQDSVEAAYQNYFDKFAELAKLRIAESYRCFVTSPNSQDAVDTLFIFGRTATEPTTYYYRSCINPTTANPTWNPWSKIDLGIPSDYVSPVFAFHKLFVFWVELQSTTSSSSTSTQKTTVEKATIKYAFQTLNGKWTQPQTLARDIVINVNPPEQNLPAGIDLNTDEIFWQKVYALAIPANGSEPEKILVLFGNLPASPTTPPSALTLPAINDKAVIAFDTQLYQSVQQGSGAQPGYISLLPASTLAGSFFAEQSFVSLPLSNSSVTTASLSVPRTALAAAAAGTQQAIFAGGYDGSSRRNVVDIYHTDTQSWTQAALPVAVRDLVATSTGNLALFAGGTNDSGLNSAVYIYHADTHSWSGTALPTARRELAATTVGNFALFAGGYDSQTVSGVVDIFRTDTAGWSSAALSVARADLAATTVGNQAIFAGGVGGNAQEVGNVDIFHADTQTWTHCTLSVPRWSLAATSVGNLAIFAGGHTTLQGMSNVVDIYHADTQTWTTSTLSAPRDSLVATTVGNQAIFAGGYSAPGVVSNVVDIYHADTQTWTTTTLAYARAGLAAATAGNQAIFAGGTSAQNIPSNIVDILGVANIIHDNYISDAANTAQDRQVEVSHLANNLGLFSINASASVLTVKNQPRWFVLDNGDEAFLAVSGGPVPQPISAALSVTHQQAGLALLYSGMLQISNPFAFTRLTTDTIQQLSQKAFIGGVDYLLTPDSQFIPELDFARLQPSGAVIAPASQQLDFQGAYGLYFQEIFFHIPFLVANMLNSNQQFADAQKWYHYIFNPTQPTQPRTPTDYWPLDEGSGTIIHDKAGNNNGTVATTPNWQTVTDLPGEASRPVIQFGTQANSITLPTASIPQGQEMSISFWAFGGNSLPKQESVIYATSTINSWRVLNIHLPWVDGILYFDCGVDSTSYDRLQFPVSPDVYKGKWSHWTFTKNAASGEMCVYLNGKLWHSVTGRTRPLAPATSVILGCSTDPTMAYDGKVADLRIWNVALTPAEVYAWANEQPSDRFWRYLPFKGNTLQKLEDILQDTQAIAAYNDDPFDPDAIARLRFGSYQKAILMKYIDNLLDWGDSLFTQDTWESITQATILYLLAYDLLGPRPESVGQCSAPAPQTFAQIKAQYSNGIIPQFLLELEQNVGNGNTASVNSTPFNAIPAYFCVGENDQFTAYWDRVEDRLYKIRHCQNIAGTVRQLALFEPPLNPADLVRAAASGNVPLSVVAGLTAAVPQYRFDYLLERAKNITSTLIQLGASMLSALEKKDVEQLELLRASQEAVILQLIQTTKQRQIDEASKNIEALNQGLAAAQYRVSYYQGLKGAGLSPSEQSGQTLMSQALIPQTLALALNAIGAPLFALPDIFGLADGGQQLGMIFTTLAGASDGAAALLNQSASLATTMAQYERRAQEWDLQVNLATDDTLLIGKQIEAAQIALDIAQSELATQQKSIEQANEVEDFLRRKFTNQDLYQWMINRLSVLYFQTFKLALELALSVQKAYQYELNRDDTYIGFDYWDSLKQGLLAGEGLLFGLSQLEKAYIEGNTRRMEIEKTISLRQLDPVAFVNLKSSGKCQFQLSEKLFDSDFPGHYCRQIKSIALSIPAVVGPYQNIKATLTQLSDRVLVQPDSNAVTYLLTGQGNLPAASTLRSSWRRNQKIALSRGANDAGVFELNFRDERYLPFEGTGAVSTWELSMPRATNRIDFTTLSDVIIHLSYTALDAGDGPFTGQVKKVLGPYTGAYYVNLNQSFPGAWSTFLSAHTDPKTQQLRWNLSNQIVPPQLTNVNATNIFFQLDVPDTSILTGTSFISLQIGNAAPIPVTLPNKSNSILLPAALSSDQFSNDWVMSVDLTKAPPAMLKNGFLDPTIFQNIECVLFYQGTIDWNS